ncbi:unnamed protein product [Ostreobium quekettii]|nr:unnamed protein product [Ostreobium quekettii]
MAGGEGSAGATPSADAGAGQADNSGTGMGHSEGAVTPEKSKVENGAQVSDACAGPTPMLGTDETGMDPKRKREEGSDGKGSAAEKGPNAVEEPANKKGKVEVDTVGLVSPSPSTGDGSTPFAAFASSASPFQGMASGTDFGNSNIFSAPPLNLGSGTAPAFSFGTQIAPLQSVEGAGLLAKTPMGGGAGNPSGSVTLSTDGTGGQSLQNKPLFSSGPAAKLPQQVKVVTGEEDESTVFAAKGILYQMDGQTWKETCRGELRLNVQEKRSARLVMRQKATLKVCLNANLYAQMPVSMMDRSSGVVFHCVNWADEKDEEGGGAEGSQGTASKGRGGSPKVYAVRFVDKTDSGAALAESFMHLVNMYKGKVAGGGPSAPQE